MGDTEDKCPKCQGRGWTPAGNGGGYKCSACGGCGKNSQWRKKRADERRDQWLKQYQEKKEKIDDLEHAISRFDIKTNLDALVMDAAQKHLNDLKWHLNDYKPRARKN